MGRKTGLEAGWAGHRLGSLGSVITGQSCHLLSPCALALVSARDAAVVVVTQGVCSGDSGPCPGAAATWPHNTSREAILLKELPESHALSSSVNHERDTVTIKFTFQVRCLLGPEEVGNTGHYHQCEAWRPSAKF